MTCICIVRRSHARGGHLTGCESKALAIAAMQFSLDYQGVQQELAKLLHLVMIRGLGSSKGEGFGQLVKEKRILANVELEVGTWQGAVPQCNHKGMYQLALPER